MHDLSSFPYHFSTTSLLLLTNFSSSIYILSFSNFLHYKTRSNCYFYCSVMQWSEHCSYYTILMLFPKCRDGLFGCSASINSEDTWISAGADQWRMRGRALMSFTDCVKWRIKIELRDVFTAHPKLIRSYNSLGVCITFSECKQCALVNGEGTYTEQKKRFTWGWVSREREEGEQTEPNTLNPRANELPKLIVAPNNNRRRSHKSKLQKQSSSCRCEITVSDIDNNTLPRQWKTSALLRWRDSRPNQNSWYSDVDTLDVTLVRNVDLLEDLEVILGWTAPQSTAPRGWTWPTPGKLIGIASRRCSRNSCQRQDTFPPLEMESRALVQWLCHSGYEQFNQKNKDS